MSDNVGFKDGFRNKFHIGKIPRKPLRQEVTNLRARAMLLPQTDPEVKGIVIELEKAKSSIFGKVKTNKERETSIDETQAIVDDVKPELERLEEEKKKNPVNLTYEINGKQASKEDVRRAKDMLAMLTPLEQSVDELFKPKGDAPGVLMPPDLGRLDLLGQIETVRVHISQTIVDETVGKELSKEIGAARQKINEARVFIEHSRGLISGYDKQWNDGSVVLQAVAKELNKLAPDKSNGKIPPAANTPLGKVLTTLRDRTHPDGGLIVPEGMKAASDAVEKELQKALADTALYAKTCCEGAQKQHLIDETLKVFDKALKDPLKQLFDQASAMGAPDHSVLSGECNEARSRISGQIVPEQVDVPKITDPLIVKINDAITKLKKEAEALRKRVEDAHTALTTALDNIADTKGKQFFAADWIAVDALHNTIEGLMPAKNAPLDQATIDKLGSVEPLIAKLKAQADALDPARSGPAEGKFDLAKAAIEKVLVKKDSPARTLKKYDPKKWGELEEGFTKIDKSVGTVRFAEAVKAIEDFKTTKFDPAVKAGKELSPVINAARKIYDQFNGLYVDAQMEASENGLPTPNTQQLTLKALHAELKKTPPDKARLETLKTDVEAAFKDIKNTRDLTRAMVASNKTEKAKAETEKKDAKANREPLQDRYYSLEMQFEEAKAMVREANGDENAIKSLKRLMEQAESEIKAVTGDKKTTTKPEATLNRIQQRIDLMISHPEGEANRRLAELPALYNEFRKTREDAGGHLGGVMSLIGEFMSQEGNEKGVEDLLDRVTEYAVRFTCNGDTFGRHVDALVDVKRPEGERRKAREMVLAGIGELQRGLLNHPISKLLAESPIGGAKGVPHRLVAVLDRLEFTVLTSVES